MKYKRIKYNIVLPIRVLLSLLLLGLHDDLLAVPRSCPTSFLSNLTITLADTIPLVHMTVGAEIRTRYEKYWNDNWGAAPKDDNGYFLHRLLFFTIIPIGHSFHVMAELKSALHSNQDIPPRPVDEDNLDFQKLLVEINLSNSHKKSSLAITIGRQELEYTRSVPGKRFGNLDVYYIGFSRKQISNNIKDFVNFYDEGPYHEDLE